jgi:hypothetical protein
VHYLTHGFYTMDTPYILCVNSVDPDQPHTSVQSNQDLHCWLFDEKQPYEV